MTAAEEADAVFGAPDCIAPICFAIALRVGTGLNAREHHHVRAERVKAERMATAAAFRAHVPLHRQADAWTRPLLVTLTRVGPRKVDDDGATGGLKAVRDEIAELLGLDDGDRARIRFKYGDPEIGPFAVRVEIASLGRCEACGALKARAA